MIANAVSALFSGEIAATVLLRGRPLGREPMETEEEDASEEGTISPSTIAAAVGGDKDADSDLRGRPRRREGATVNGWALLRLLEGAARMAGVLGKWPEVTLRGRPRPRRVGSAACVARASELVAALESGFSSTAFDSVVKPRRDGEAEDLQAAQFHVVTSVVQVQECRRAEDEVTITHAHRTFGPAANRPRNVKPANRNISAHSHVPL